MKIRIHAAAGMIGFVTILLFWTSTAGAELFATDAVVTSVKSLIVLGLGVLVPCMVIVGATGMSLAGDRSDTLVMRKKKKMPFIALNGILILVPSALFLSSKAGAGEFDPVFYTVQGLELVAGAVNLVLMATNIRDGLKMTGRLAR